MRIVVVGLGSMGKRRIRLIKKYNKNFEIIGVDSKVERCKTCEEEWDIKTSDNLDEVLENHEIDCGFVCTAPLSHSKIITKMLEHNLHVFTELNLVAEGYEENIALAKEKDKRLFLSSTFLYRREICKINQLVKSQEQKLNYTYHVGQYLPDWHPWESYKDFFVGDKRTNGCREIFAIELPWLVNTFGPIQDIIVKKSKMTGLEVGYSDNYMVMVGHESGHSGMLAVDVVSRKAVRNLEVIGENLYLSWDGSGQGLKKMDLENNVLESIDLYETIDQLKLYQQFIVENAYANEIKAFFESITSNIEPIYDFKKDKEILSWIDQIEGIDNE